jgi:hypothetical protein
MEQTVLTAGRPVVQCTSILYTVWMRGRRIGVTETKDMMTVTDHLRASYNFMADPDTLNIKGEPKYFKGKGDSGGDTKRYFCGTCGR